MFVDGNHYDLRRSTCSKPEKKHLWWMTSIMHSPSSFRKEVKEIIKVNNKKWLKTNNAYVKNQWKSHNGVFSYFILIVFVCMYVSLDIESGCQLQLLIFCHQWQLVLYNITTANNQDCQLPLLRKLSKTVFQFQFQLENIKVICYW